MKDFGFARVMSGNQNGTQEDLIKSYPNTPLYAAPDLLKQRPYDDKCDLWSIGAIAYELMVGEPLFKVKNFDVRFHHLNLFF